MACGAQTWHHGIRLDIKTFVLEFVLTLWCWYVYYIWTKQSSFKKNWMVVLTLWCSSWNYNVHVYNIYEQNKRLLKRWWSWHYDVRLDIKKACTADLFPAKTNHVICFNCDLICCDLWWASTVVHNKNCWFSVSRHSK